MTLSEAFLPASILGLLMSQIGSMMLIRTLFRRMEASEERELRRVAGLYE